MSEQADIPKVERHFEGRYRYLADLARHQPSPNLRLHYHDSFSKRAESHQRRSPRNDRPSPMRSRERQSSFKRSEERHPGSNRHYSPSCSTFNPRRETTQEEFSPYDQRAEKEEERLTKELLEENAKLRAQLIKASDSIESLRAELSRKDVEISRRDGDLAKKQADLVQVKQSSLAQIRYYQKVVAEMTNEIQIVLTKNKMLENQLAAADAHLKEELRRHEQLLRFEEDRIRHQELRRREEQFWRREADIGRRDGKISQQPSKRSVGKVVARPHHANQSLGASKIKIQDESEYIGQQTMKCGHKYAGDKQNKKSEQLISSIKSMQLKICGKQAGSLRELWKWLKEMGHSHSCLKRWKARASQSSSATADKLKELIRQACGYIQ